jgi:RNA polymerase sigma-70 factor (ECF subfamily)
MEHYRFLWCNPMAQNVPERAEGVALIRRITDEDRQAFSDFYDRYARLVFALIRRIIIQPAEAEEVLQEVFWQVWMEADTYDEERGSPEAWLLNRARSRAIDKLRSIRRRRETFVAPVDERTWPARPDGTLSTEAGEAVRSALALLPGSQREVIELAFYQGLTQSEIALRLGEPLGTIKTRMRLGLERLRGHFRSTDPETA